MATTKNFHIGDILSVLTDRLVSPDHIGGVYNILNWMTGDSLMTHQLPRVSDECRPSLCDQHPDLAAVVVPADLSGEGPVKAWVAEQVAVYGETRPVAPLSPADHTSIDPIAEIKMIRPYMPIIGIEVDPS